MPGQTTVLTPEFRVSFPAVFRPKRQLNGEMQYEVTMLFPVGADLSELKKLAGDTARAKWGDQIPANLKGPFRDGAEKAHLDGYEEGVTFVRAWSSTRPGVADQDVKPIIAEEGFYAGCYARATIHAFAYDRPEKKGVSFGLDNVQFLRDGEPFGASRADIGEDFAPVAREEGAAAAPAATSGDPLFG